MENIYNNPTTETPNVVRPMPRRMPPMNDNTKKTTMWVVGTLIILIAAFFTARYFISKPEITTFQECADAGYPVMESFPEQCKTPDGKTFTNDASIAPGYAVGKVTFQPICPPGQSTCTLPVTSYASSEAVLYGADKTTVITRVRLAADGSYRIGAKPGSYWLEIRLPDGGQTEMRPVTITSGATATTDFTIDMPLYAKG